jgi:8-oxo-dGTP diphosphatase
MSLLWKKRLARLVRFPLVWHMMSWGILLTVPKQRIGVAVVALDEEKRVLLLRHVFHPYVPWGLPGGWLNRNEAPEEGALRELKEETGLSAEIGPPLLISSGTSPSHTSIVYRAALQPGKMKLSSEILEAGWFAIADLPKPLTTSVKKAIAATFASTHETARYS